jgi:hypothetical protein
MAAFANDAEVDRYAGGVLRLAAADPDVGPALAAASTYLCFVLTDPDCELNVFLFDPVRVVVGRSGLEKDVSFRMSADVLDAFWRGEYDLRDGLARGDVVATGRISRVLKLLPLMAPMVPVYLAMVASRDLEEVASQCPVSPSVAHPRHGARRTNLRSMS